ncbi:lysylphosphatidylglycerol synthase transmembrane domain-containing protein [Salibacter sp.]|jgi:uncharacterized protein (TIRG00374 family)|uniref:lysylphosphatidylglycerol synthase transmembrane domain-containing protein n=1 Tax=Salibacter sp. TaxID=2010995 RepID=UPI00286FD55D|nr:lysylphosphatidylglycerol synthase transmembrane domain-containing protein [Salibacter sp.]MDR9397623.1 lysylphosphatidylglycerol synthase transmembrane domain-containing protein [Salibacter sp.]MDR9486777.1 lysylphosphatidylglycerol synthase transmembrane domain-containing protein [Salibacter sp.]
MAKKRRNKKSSPIRKLMDPRRIIIPIVLGLGVAGYLLYSELDPKAFRDIDFTGKTYFWIFIALLAAAAREFGYMYRLRILSDKRISWRNVFDDIMLWEFSSAITPSVVGGSGVAIFILSKEKLSVGRSTAIVMTTAFLDELFYVISVPLLFVVVGTTALFPDTIPNMEVFGMRLGVQQVFWIGYVFILLLITVILLGIFVSPQGFKKLLIRVFSLPFLKRWLRAAYRTGDEVVTTSDELREKPFIFWVRAFLATSLSWTARYLTANFLLLAFTSFGFMDNLLVLSRQLVMWVIMLISPTPGSAGVAEIAFDQFLADYTPIGIMAAVAFLWRLFTYYPYLFLGIIILPRWIQRVYLGRKLITFKKPQK